MSSKSSPASLNFEQGVGVCNHAADIDFAGSESFEDDRACWGEVGGVSTELTGFKYWSLEVEDAFGFEGGGVTGPLIGEGVRGAGILIWLGV